MATKDVIAPDKRDAMAFVDMFEASLIKMLADFRAVLAGKVTSREDLATASDAGLLYPYRVKAIPMDTAGVNVLIDAPGDIFAVRSNGTMDGVMIRVDDEGHDEIPVLYFNPWHQEFSKLYVSFPAQTGRTLYVAIGQERKVQIELQNAQIRGSVFKIPELIYSDSPIVAGTFLSTLSDTREVKRILLFAVSTLDVAVTVQPMGNWVNEPAGCNLISVPIPLPAGGAISIGLADDDWHPYIGATIVAAIPPTTGALVIYAIEQE